MTHNELLARVSKRVNYLLSLQADDLQLSLAELEELALMQALRAVVELHKPETDYNERIVCGFCKTLCHSRSGLGCDYEGDALYPCSTIVAIEGQLG